MSFFVEIRTKGTIIKSMNKSIDMTSGPLVSKILLYAIPLALTSMLQQLFNAADIAVIGRFAGTQAMAAVGANSSLISLFVNLFTGISLGTNVVIAHSIGSKDTQSVHKVVHTSILVAIIGGVFMTLIGECFSFQILSLMAVPTDIFHLALRYLRIYLLGMPVIFLYNFLSAIYRGQGNTKKPLYALALAGIVNVLLNLFCVIVLHMSVEGVALATVTSNVVSSCILFVSLLKSKE